MPVYRFVVIVVLIAFRTSAAQQAPQPAPQRPADPAPPPAPAPAVPAGAPAQPAQPAGAGAAQGAVTAEAAPSQPEDETETWSMRIGGYVQPQFRTRQNSPAPFDEDGFRFARVRLTGIAEGTAGNLKLSALLESELQPTFTLTDAYVTVMRPFADHGSLALDIGQSRVPISRQQLLSDSRLSFVDKAQLASIAPDRDLGVRATAIAPGVPVLLMAGVFNGEGRNQVQNINEGYLYAGRVEYTPVGHVAPLAESAFTGNWASVAVSVGHNALTPGDYHEKRLYLGADVSGAYRGISGSFEYLEVRYRYSGDAMKFPGPEYKANGLSAHLAYLLPYKLPPLEESRVEIGARVEEIDRNDTVPIPQLGDPNQSMRTYTGVVSLYIRQHQLKAQLSASHSDEIENQTSTGTDATYANDQVLLQVTYRVE